MLLFVYVIFCVFHRCLLLVVCCWLFLVGWLLLRVVVACSSLRSLLFVDCGFEVRCCLLLFVVCRPLLVYCVLCVACCRCRSFWFDVGCFWLSVVS